MLEGNQKSWHNKLVHALWENRLTIKKSIGMSPYQLVYGTYAIFQTSLGVLVMKLIQEVQSEDDDMKIRIHQTIHLQQTREEVYIKAQQLQENIKKLFDKRTKASDFKIGDKVLKWDSRREDKGKHGKFDNLWQGPYLIQSAIGKNAFFCKNWMEMNILEVLSIVGCSNIIFVN